MLAACVPDAAGDSALAQELLSRAVTLAGNVVGQPARASALATLAEAYAAIGDHARARQYAEQAEDLARSAPHAKRMVGDLTAVTQAVSGLDPMRAEALAERALALIKDDIDNSKERFTLQVGLVKALSGVSTQAAARDLARRITSPYRKPDHIRKLATSACKAGLGEDAVEFARSILDPACLSSALAACVKEFARTGDKDRAAQLLREAEIALKDAGWAAMPATHTLEAALESGHTATAKNLFERAWQEASGSWDAGAESLIGLLEANRKCWPSATARHRTLTKVALKTATRIKDAEPRISAITRLVGVVGANCLDDLRAPLEQAVTAAMELTDPARSRALDRLARANALLRSRTHAQASLDAEQVPAQELPADVFPALATAVAVSAQSAATPDPACPDADAPQRSDEPAATLPTRPRDRIRELCALVRRAPEGADVPMWLEEASHLAKGLKDAGDRAQARAELAEAAARADQRDTAGELIEDARVDCDLITVTATSFKVLSTLAVAASTAGDVPGARDALRRAAAFVPMTSEGLDSHQVELLARMVADAGDHAHALALARTIDDPEANASVTLAIAKSLLKQENPARARALVKALRGGHRARGLAALARWAEEEGLPDWPADLLADAVEETRNLQELPAREEAAAEVVKSAAAAFDYETAVEALAMVADSKRHDKALLSIAQSHVRLRDYLAAQEDIEQINNPADKVNGLTLFISAGWAGEDGNRQWAAEGARYVADIADPAEQVLVCARFAQALAGQGRRDVAVSLIKDAESIAVSLTGSARSNALAALARAAMTAKESDLADSLVADIKDPSKRARTRRAHLLTSAPDGSTTPGDPESGAETGQAELFQLLLDRSAREKDFTLPERRRYVAKALTLGRWTSALVPLGRVDADALLAVANDFLAPGGPCWLIRRPRRGASRAAACL